MRRITTIAITLLGSLVLMSACSTDVSISIKNTSEIDRKNEIVEIPISSFPKSKIEDNESYVAINSKGDTLAAQITYDGKLIFPASVKSNSSENYVISVVRGYTADTKVFGRLFPERGDDFSWENDKVGFRLYGAALMKSDGPSNGIDLWYKRTNKIVLNEWYRKNMSGEASYHIDHGEGCDPYMVGRSLGAGSMAPFVNDSLLLNANFDAYEILENGPLRLTFKLTYPEMDVDGEMVKDIRTISIDAGSQLTKISQEYSVSKPVTVATGIVKRVSNDSVLIHQDENFFVYREPKTKNGEIFPAIYVPAGVDSIGIHSYINTHVKTKKETKFSHVLAFTQYTPNQPVVYYTGFGWDKAGFNGVEAFEAYMKQFVAIHKTPLSVEVK